MIALLPGSAAILCATEGAVIIAAILRSAAILLSASREIRSYFSGIRPRTRAAEIRICTLESSGDAMRVRHSAAMRRIVGPGRVSIGSAVKIVKAPAMEERIVHIDSAAEPAESPPPAAPTAAAREIET
jgi:hypothetical protein